MNLNYRVSSLKIILTAVPQNEHMKTLVDSSLRSILLMQEIQKTAFISVLPPKLIDILGKTCIL